MSSSNTLESLTLLTTTAQGGCGCGCGCGCDDDDFLRGSQSMAITLPVIATAEPVERNAAAASEEE